MRHALGQVRVACHLDMVVEELPQVYDTDDNTDEMNRSDGLQTDERIGVGFADRPDRYLRYKRRSRQECAW